MASLTESPVCSCTNVFTAKRRAGGVAIMDRSRIPLKAMFKVRGIGVAVRVNISTSARIALIRSLSRTPKRCSSSTIIKPKSLNWTLSCRILCVPITISTLPSAKSSIVFVCDLLLPKRDKTSIRIGQSAKRSLNDS